MTKKTPPASIDAERDVLGACMKYTEALDEATAKLEIQDFYSELHRLVYEAIIKLHNDSKTVDITTVANQLKRDNRLDAVGGRTYIASLSEYGLTENIDSYVRIVLEKSNLRKLIKHLAEAVEKCYLDQETADKIIDNIESMVMSMSINKGADICTHVKDIVPEILEDLEKTMTGEKTYVHTGFNALDELVVGLSPSDLIVLAARPAMGKSGLVMNIAENLAKQGKPCGVFSLEMSKQQLTKRIQYGMARVSGTNAELGHINESEMDRITRASNELARLPIYIDDSATLSPAALKAKARRMVSKHKVQCIIIDYIQLMTGGGDNRTQEVGEIARSCKLIAKELNVPVIALSQLSRNCETRTDKRPILSDLRDSGEIEQHCDEAWLLYREIEYLKHLDRKDPKRVVVENTAEVIVRKNRDGATGTVLLSFIPEYARFENMTKAEEHSL